MNFINDNHCLLITEWNRDVLNQVVLQRYTETISRKGSSPNSWFGFTDGMVQSISRPGNGQRIVYNGHKRVYGLQFQSITLPNELIGNIFGLGGKYFNRILIRLITTYFHRYWYGIPTPKNSLWTPVSEGRRHDVGMLADCGLPNDMGNFAFSPTGQPLCVYGDPAYKWIWIESL